MDLLFATCQGLGLAIAIGLVIGTLMPASMPPWAAAVVAVPLGVVACVATLKGADEAIWPALLVGLLGAGPAALVSRDVTLGAARRQDVAAAEGGSSAAVSAIVILVAIAVALVCLVFPPLALPPLALLAWLMVQRRRAAERKYEGLRVLR